MADLKALRRRLEAKIAKLHAQVEAIDLIESVDQEGEPELAQPKPKAKVKAVSKTRTAVASRPTYDSSPSMSQFCKDLLGDAWKDMDDLVPAVQAKYEGTARAAILTAYRRWEERGAAELKGSREAGFKARLKAQAEKGGDVSSAA